MADPFSIVAGTAGILDICWRVGSYLRSVKSAASKIELDLAALSFEVNALVSVTESIQSLWNDSSGIALDSKVPDAKRIEELWQDINLALCGCRQVMGRLARLVDEVIGKNGIEIQGKRDGIRKVLRKQAKDDEVRDIRQQITSHQNSLQLTLSALNLYDTSDPNESQMYLISVSCYVRSARDANGQSVELLSEKVEYWGFKLNHELAAIRTQVTADSEHKACLFMRRARPLLIIALTVTNICCCRHRLGGASKQALLHSTCCQQYVHRKN